MSLINPHRLLQAFVGLAFNLDTRICRVRLCTGHRYASHDHYDHDPDHDHHNPLWPADAVTLPKSQ